jgi:hypothetical protein
LKCTGFLLHVPCDHHQTESPGEMTAYHAVEKISDWHASDFCFMFKPTTIDQMRNKKKMKT